MEKRISKEEQIQELISDKKEKPRIEFVQSVNSKIDQYSFFFIDSNLQHDKNKQEIGTYTVYRFSLYFLQKFWAQIPKILLFERCFPIFHPKLWEKNCLRISLQVLGLRS